MNTEIKNLIVDNRKKDRPLSEKSVSAYASTLCNLYKKAFEGTEFDSDNFNNYKHILGYLGQFVPSRRKTILASLMTVATDETALSEYRKLMAKDAKQYDNEIAKNEMTDKFREHWITPKELDTLGNTLRNEWVELYDKYRSGIEPLTIKEKQRMQEYIIFLLTSGRYGLPPRRLLDWTEMKIENYDARKKQQEKLNYNIYEPKKKQFIFSRFKTDDTFKRQIIKAPPYIEQYLNIWISLLEKGFTPKTLHRDHGVKGEKPLNSYLLTDTKNSKLSPITLHQRMNKIYGEGKSVNSLRHSYITSKYKDVPSVKDMQDTAMKMGHSVRSALTYIKR